MKLQVQEQIFSLESPPTPQCHASTIAEYKGTLYAAWFGGTKEGHADVGIWLSRRVDRAWTAPACMAGGDIPHWNPVLFALGDKLFLYYKKGVKITGWYTCYRVWENGAWSPEQELVPGDTGGRGPVKNKPVLLRDGTICAPASIEKKKRPLSGRNWRAFIDVSRDGLSWKAQKIIPAKVNLIQPTLWESETGVHALLRSNAGAVYRSDSGNGGNGWSRAYATDIPNNNSGIDAVYYNGKLYLIHNPVRKNWGPRTPLVIASSPDNGLTWDETLTLEDAPGEYSYPSIIAAGGALHAVYTHQRRGIVYARAEL